MTCDIQHISYVYLLYLHAIRGNVCLNILPNFFWLWWLFVFLEDFFMSFESTLYILGICLSFFQINPLQIFVIFDMSFLWIACSLNNVSLKPFSNLLLGTYQPFVMRYWEILTLLFCFIFCLFYFLSFIALLHYCDIESLDSSMMFSHVVLCT